MASASSLLFPLSSAPGRSFSSSPLRSSSNDKVHRLVVGSLSSDHRISSTMANECKVDMWKRRDMIGLAFGGSLLLVDSFDANGAGLPPEEKPRLCDETCEKELENIPMVTTESGLQYKDIKVGSGPSPPVGFQVAASYVAMVPSGQIFDSSLDKGQIYIFRVGSGQVIKGLDEGILSMKVGGKRRLYIPGPLISDSNSFTKEKLGLDGLRCSNSLFLSTVGIPERSELSSRKAEGGSEQSGGFRCGFGIYTGTGSG